MTHMYYALRYNKISRSTIRHVRQTYNATYMYVTYKYKPCSCTLVMILDIRCGHNTTALYSYFSSEERIDHL
jgi:hypothetical protein